MSQFRRQSNTKRRDGSRCETSEHDVRADLRDSSENSAWPSDDVWYGCAAVGFCGAGETRRLCAERTARWDGAAMASRHQRARAPESRARRVERRSNAARSSRERRCEGRRGRTRIARAIRLASGKDVAGASTRYLNTLKWPRSHQRRMKMRTVLKQPPPIFFAPYPAARPRSSLLIVRQEEVWLERSAESVPARSSAEASDAIASR